MANIQSSPYPLVFPVAAIPDSFQAKPATADRLSLRTTTRALEGMQKEAIVSSGADTSVWRMVCDEGPYLNGTDLAPFPLGFFCAGMACSFMSELLSLLNAHGISYRNVKLLQDNRYSMEGSAIKGTMTGAALPVELQLVIDSTATSSRLQELLLQAVMASPAHALLNGVYVSEFTLVHNGRNCPTVRVAQSSHATPDEPAGFDALTPVQADCRQDLITKQKSAEIKQGVAGGAGSSMAENQKRILHMQGECSIREDGLKQVKVSLFQPIGSQFIFLSDDSRAFGGQERAPSGLAYLSAGLAFCYMTQIGRYAGIRKLPLDAYHIVQDTAFSLPGASGGTGKAASMDAVVTHVYLDSGHDDDYACTVVDMSEQTCFLHAACRAPVKVKLKELSRAIPVVP